MLGTVFLAVAAADALGGLSVIHGEAGIVHAGFIPRELEASHQKQRPFRSFRHCSILPQR